MIERFLDFFNEATSVTDISDSSEVSFSEDTTETRVASVVEETVDNEEHAATSVTQKVNETLESCGAKPSAPPVFYTAFKWFYNRVFNTTSQVYSPDTEYNVDKVPLLLRELCPTSTDPDKYSRLSIDTSYKSHDETECHYCDNLRRYGTKHPDENLAGRHDAEMSPDRSLLRGFRKP